MNVYVCILLRELCVVSGWVRQSVGLGSLRRTSCCALPSAEWKHHVSVGRPEEQPCFSELRPEQRVRGGLREKEGARWTQPETCSKLLGLDYPG